MERGYNEAPSRAVREGGRERTRSFEEVGRDLLRGEREKKVFLAVPRRTNPNKHLLDVLDFLDGLDASNQTNPHVWIFLG